MCINPPADVKCIDIIVKLVNILDGGLANALVIHISGAKETVMLCGATMGILMARSTLVSSVCLLIVLPACASSTGNLGAKEGNWQALAFSRSTRADGYAFGFKTQSEAESAALAACQASDCKLVASSTQCLALVVPDKSAPYAALARAGATSYLAQKAAVAACTGGQECIVQRDVCSTVAAE